MLPNPTWEEVDVRLTASKTTTAIALSRDIPVLLLVDPFRKTLGLIAPAGPKPAAAVERVARGIRVQPHGPGQTAVWVDEPGLAKVGLDFLLVVSRRILQQGESLASAVEAQLEDWRQLVAAMAETEMAAAIGVLGELAVLRSALELGHDASCWIGMVGGAIDFRFGELECEVKTTSGSLHEHVIHGADQLQPSVGINLVLVSIQVAPAEHGHGTSLSDLVRDVAALGIERATLEEDLLATRRVSVWDPVAATGFVLRSPPAGFPVGVAFPALTANVIATLFGPDAVRIRDVKYRLRLDGLEVSRDPSVVGLLANIRL